MDVFRHEPWILPNHALFKSDNKQWYFFCRRDSSFPTSYRATREGYWEVTGRDVKIVSNNMNELGMKRTLVFRAGSAPNGVRTCWVMHEYRATLKELDGNLPDQRPFVLCRLLQEDDKMLGADVERYTSSSGSNDVR